MMAPRDKAEAIGIVPFCLLGGGLAGVEGASAPEDHTLAL